MNVAVITRHGVSNYGSLLQAMATQQVIEELGHKCEIIDYIRADESYTQCEKTLVRNKPQWAGSPIKKAAYLLLRQPESIAAGKRFELARKRYLHLTRRYTSADALSKEKPLADVYLTGSDQVWGPVADGTYDSSYCLSFAADSDKKIAYAASFGHTDMTPELMAYYRKWLSRYKKITVREDSGVKLLKDMGLDAAQVIDPTLLLDADYWHRYTKPIRRDKFILIYQIHNDKRLGDYAQRVSKAMGLPLVRLSPSLHQITRPGKLVWLPDVGEFLSYIQNAECLITDSFHGTAFAINFNTPFVEVLPNNNTGTRNVSILKATGLSHRILTDTGDVALAMKKMDFNHANQVLAQLREESLGVLKQMIEA